MRPSLPSSPSSLALALALALVALSAVTACGKSPVPPKETNGDPAAAVARVTSASSGGPIATPAASRADVLGCPIEIALVPDSATIIVGQPLYMTLRVTTTCDKKLAVLDGGDYRNRLGRPDSFTVELVNAAGAPITPIEVGPGFGGLTGPRPLQKDKAFEKRLLLAHWFAAQPRGRYTVTVSKRLLIGETSTPNEDDKTATPVRASAVIDVRSGSPAEMGALVDAIGNKALGEDDAADEAIRALTALDDERAVPYFVKLATGKRQSARMYGVWGLRPYATDAALAALEKALGEDDLKIAAAQTIAESRHPRAWDVLWTHRADKDDNVRLTVLHALAKKTDLPDRVARLRGFAGDPAPLVRQEAQRYLREAGAN